MLLTERYSKQISGILHCYDRIVIQGTLPGLCYAGGMTSYLYFKKIRIFDYPKFAEPFKNEIRNNAEKIAQSNELQIQFLQKRNIRKETIIKKILDKRGHHPGLVHIFSAMEACPSYKPWHNKKSGKTYLKSVQGKCLHYYFYFIDPQLGLCYVRVPTWCPFRLQVYFNGHNQLASLLKQKDIEYSLLDNAITKTDSFAKAQQLSDDLQVKLIHDKLDAFAQAYCPVISHFKLHYHWSIMQIEYATDIIFKRRQDLQQMYDNLTRTAIHCVKPDNIATFLGRKLHPNYQDEMGNTFSTRIEGTRIKHTMGKASIKMYDKFGLILRIETTVNDVSFFKHYRTVEHRDGTTSKKLAQMKKGLYSIGPLQKLLFDSNRRYLQFISDLTDPSAGVKKLEKVTATIVKNHRPYKGFNFFDSDDQKVFQSIASGEFTISGFQNKHLREKIHDKNTSQISRILKRLRTHGLIKKVAKTYKYYLTRFGSKVITTGLKLKELYIIPQLATLA
ncbi:MAG: MarR family transcriptional regulator [Candidatus Helarchaeota archaeon]|nr:MarR family transcriptional regulator [Candidatus Helarchaeota archaeon]